MAYRKNVAYRNSSTYPGEADTPATPAVAGRGTTGVTGRRSFAGVLRRRASTSIASSGSTTGR